MASCEERIPFRLESRLEDINDLLFRENSGDETASDEIFELPLGISEYSVVRIDLSTGGPGDWFECHIDKDGSIQVIEYHFNDWFDHASLKLRDREFDIAEAFCQRFIVM